MTTQVILFANGASTTVAGAIGPSATTVQLAGSDLGWRELLARTRLRPNQRHHFARDLVARGPFTHVRLSIFPDGGVSRLRIHGRPRLA